MPVQETQLGNIRNETSQKAIVFLHGFSGKRDETWERFPGFVGTVVPGWDIYTLGYSTSFQPDILGVWAADPDLPILSKMFITQLSLQPLNEYRQLTLIAHSMGGLVVQRAILDDPELRNRVVNLFLFGTPSNGLRKASWLRFWKRQFRNMGKQSVFINKLRDDWNTVIDGSPDFCLRVIGGSRDQFVSPESSLLPFEDRFHRVVSGNHLDIVKPDNVEDASVRLVTSVLQHGCERGIAKNDEPLIEAAEKASENISHIVESRGENMSEKEVVNAALALDRAGKRNESIDLLKRYVKLGTDVQGTLAGRIKRMYLENERAEDAKYALSLYEHALNKALPDDHAQVYYHAINVAFLSFIVFDDKEKYLEMARLALEHCNQADRDYWNTATQAEAWLYHENYGKAIKLYKEALQQVEPASLWKLDSTGMQAALVASHLNNRTLQEEFDKIFSSHARETNKIFVSYSHKDIPWKERLVTMMAPYLRSSDQELVFWQDSEIKAGDLWRKEINYALETAGVAVLLVSPDFLASDFIYRIELPAIIKAVRKNQLKLTWIYLSHAGYEETDINEFQAAHDVSQPLSALEDDQVNGILKEVAIKIKEAAIGLPK